MRAFALAKANIKYQVSEIRLLYAYLLISKKPYHLRPNLHCPWEKALGIVNLPLPNESFQNTHYLAAFQPMVLIQKNRKKSYFYQEPNRFQ